jgi:amidophosphoribosyltransferase
MSEQIKHECGIVQIRLRKPLDFYKEKYGTTSYGLNNLYLLMEKQHNRGQEGAGIACVKLESEAGSEYIFRSRAMGSRAIDEVFGEVNKAMAEAGDVAYTELPFIGELYIGHLRYSTTGRSGISYTHPFLRRNNWKSRNLCLAGNFNLTNVNQVFDSIVASGQHPRHNADTFIMLEQLGSLLDEQVQGLFDKYKAKGYRGAELNAQIEASLDLGSIIREASTIWDGGFVITGMTGSGDSFIFRDRWGIRPAHYYVDDEIFVAASERAVIQTVMNAKFEDIHELAPGEAILIKRDGEIQREQILAPHNPHPCSFERIYFSRGTDKEIYQERKSLGRTLVPEILKSTDYDIDHTVFSFIPNTAEVAFYGMMEGLEQYLDEQKTEELAALPNPSRADIERILARKVRQEKLAVKDIKLRTFIAEGSSRNDLAAHVYDITYGTITPHEDTIVVIDDSIVRGTTLKQSIVKILSRLGPKRIVIASSSPQVRYPDYYGIDMSRMGEFIAFNAAIELLKENNMGHVMKEVYDLCRSDAGVRGDENFVKKIYAPFTDRQLTDKIAEIVTPAECNCEVRLVYQTIQGLHESCPEHDGDWYFSGNYPTVGGTKLVNRAFVNFYEGSDKRW